MSRWNNGNYTDFAGYYVYHSQNGTINCGVGAGTGAWKGVDSSGKIVPDGLMHNILCSYTKSTSTTPAKLTLYIDGLKQGETVFPSGVVYKQNIINNTTLGMRNKSWDYTYDLPTSGTIGYFGIFGNSLPEVDAAANPTNDPSKPTAALTYFSSPETSLNGATSTAMVSYTESFLAPSDLGNNQTASGATDKWGSRKSIPITRVSPNLKCQDGVRTGYFPGTSITGSSYILGNVQNCSFNSNPSTFSASYVPEVNTDDFTVSAWVKRTGSTGQHQTILMSRYQDYPNNVYKGYYMYIDPNNNFDVGIGVGNYGWTGMTDTSTVVQNGKWYHVAFSFSSSTKTLKLYVNGTLTKTRVSAYDFVRNDSATTTIGSRNIAIDGSYKLDLPFYGTISNVTFYPGVIRQEAIIASKVLSSAALFSDNGSDVPTLNLIDNIQPVWVNATGTFAANIKNDGVSNDNSDPFATSYQISAVSSGATPTVNYRRDYSGYTGSGKILSSNLDSRGSFNYECQTNTGCNQGVNNYIGMEGFYKNIKVSSSEPSYLKNFKDQLIDQYSSIKLPVKYDQGVANILLNSQILFPSTLFNQQTLTFALSVSPANCGIAVNPPTIEPNSFQTYQIPMDRNCNYNLRARATPIGYEASTVVETAPYEIKRITFTQFTNISHEWSEDGKNIVLKWDTPAGLESVKDQFNLTIFKRNDTNESLLTQTIIVNNQTFTYEVNKSYETKPDGTTRAVMRLDFTGGMPANELSSSLSVQYPASPTPVVGSIGLSLTPKKIASQNEYNNINTFTTHGANGIRHVKAKIFNARSCNLSTNYLSTASVRSETTNLGEIIYDAPVCTASSTQPADYIYVVGCVRSTNENATLRQFKPLINYYPNSKLAQAFTPATSNSYQGTLLKVTNGTLRFNPIVTTQGTFFVPRDYYTSDQDRTSSSNVEDETTQFLQTTKSRMFNYTLDPSMYPHVKNRLIGRVLNKTNAMIPIYQVDRKNLTAKDFSDACEAQYPERKTSASNPYPYVPAIAQVANDPTANGHLMDERAVFTYVIGLNRNTQTDDIELVLPLSLKPINNRQNGTPELSYFPAPFGRGLFRSNSGVYLKDFIGDMTKPMVYWISLFNAYALSNDTNPKSSFRFINLPRAESDANVSKNNLIIPQFMDNQAFGIEFALLLHSRIERLRNSQRRDVTGTETLLKSLAQGGSGVNPFYAYNEKNRFPKLTEISFVYDNNNLEQYPPTVYKISSNWLSQKISTEQDLTDAEKNGLTNDDIFNALRPVAGP